MEFQAEQGPEKEREQNHQKHQHHQRREENRGSQLRCPPQIHHHPVPPADLAPVKADLAPVKADLAPVKAPAPDFPTEPTTPDFPTEAPEPQNQPHQNQPHQNQAHQNPPTPLTPPEGKGGNLSETGNGGD